MNLFRVLKPSYVMNCKNAGAFASELESEWGYDDTSDSAQSSKHWRQVRENNLSSLIFEGWNVILYVSSGKVNSFQRILMAGGATITQDGLLPGKINYIFLENEKFMSMISPTVKSFISPKNALKDVYLMKIDYVAELLLKKGVVTRSAFTMTP